MLSCSVVALVSSLLGLLGLAGVGHYYHHHSPRGIFQGDEPREWGHHGHHGSHHEHSMEAMKHKCDEGFTIIKCHRMCGDDMVCHDSCPLPKCPKMASKVKGIIQCNQKCGSDARCREVCNRPVKMFVEKCSQFQKWNSLAGLADFQKPDFQHLKPLPAQFIVSKFRLCHAKCGEGDVQCMEKCPKPFWMQFKKTCDEAIPIMKCHQTCGHDHECHQKCPLPSCPHMKAEVEGTMKCHEQCGADRECHHMCPKPMKKILMKCEAFMESQVCHEKCHDFKCHHDCPKARLWKFFGKHDFGHHGGFHHHHDGFHRHHDGDFHRNGPQPVIDPIAPMPAVPVPAFMPEPKQSAEKTITCSMKCGEDKDCWKKCQGYWMELRKDCSEMTQIMSCHKKCHHDHMCHQNCPRPQMPWLKEKVEASLACHHECGQDQSCHHNCKCPFAEMKEKCASLGPSMGSWKAFAPATEVLV